MGILGDEEILDVEIGQLVRHVNASLKHVSKVVLMTYNYVEIESVKTGLRRSVRPEDLRPISTLAYMKIKKASK